MLRRKSRLRRDTEKSRAWLAKPRKPIAKRSAEKAKADRELTALRPLLIERSEGRCEARFSAYCTGVGTVPHHILKRSARRFVHDLKLILWVCEFCNSDIELRDAEAVAAGLTIKSWNAPKRVPAR